MIFLPESTPNPKATSSCHCCSFPKIIAGSFIGTLLAITVTLIVCVFLAGTVGATIAQKLGTQMLNQLSPSGTSALKEQNLNWEEYFNQPANQKGESGNVTTPENYVNPFDQF